MGNVRLYGSTSGYTELAPPAIAPDGVLALPTGTGTLATAAYVDAAVAAGGKILQVVRATDSTDRSTTSDSFVDASISVTITPQKSDSIILLWWLVYQDPANGQYMYNQISDSSNNALSGAEGSAFGSTANSMATLLSMIGYSAPATTSATTYKGRFRSGESGLAAQLFNAQNTGQIYAIEVAA